MALQLAGPPGPIVLSPEVLAAAESGNAAATLAIFDREGYCSIDTRSLYQSTLLHIAAKHGHVELAQQLLARGADVLALDYGGMRRSPLHWASQRAHVAMVELLVDHGADTTADGRSWSKLVQGQRCGSLIPTDQPTESLESLCRTNAVRLALTRPTWQPEIHSQWPERFKEVAKLLLLASSCARSRPHGSGSDPDSGSSWRAETDPGCRRADVGCSQGAAAVVLPLNRDSLLEVLRRAAYPISTWL